MKPIRRLQHPLILQFVFWMTLISLWESLIKFECVPRFLLPSPTDLIIAFNENPDYFISGFKQTFRNSTFGFFMSTIIGFSIGSLLTISSLLNRFFFPIAHFFQTLPIIAIAPLLVIYFGFGDATVQAASMIVSLFPMVANTVVGLNSVPKEYIELFRYAHASMLNTLIYLRIGFGLPVIFSGLKISSGLAVIGAIAGEFVAGGGLGQIIDVAKTQLRVDQVFVALLLLSLIGLFYLSTIQVIEYFIKKWRPFFPLE